MKKEWIRNLAAFLLLGALVLYVSLSRKSTFESKEKEEKAKKIVSVDLDAVDRIDVTNSKAKVTFDRRKKDAKGKFTDRFAPYSWELDNVSDWIIRSPAEAFPDFYTVNTLLDNLKELESGKTIDDAGKDPKQYNLQNPPLTIALYERGATVPKLTLKVGDANSASSGLYIQTSSSPKIILTSSMTLDYLKTRQANDWRNKNLIGVKDVKKAKALSIKYNEGGKPRELSAVRTESGWETGNLAKIPLDTMQVEGFLGDIKALRVDALESEGGAERLQKFGFKNPFAKFSFEFDAEGGKQKREFEMAVEKGKTEVVRVRRLDFPEIYTVGPQSKSNLTKKLLDLVEKQPLLAEEASVTSLRITNEGKTTEAEKAGGNWKMTKPLSDALDRAEISALIRNLSELKATEAVIGEKISGVQNVSVRMTVAGKEKELNFFESDDKKVVKGLRGDAKLGYRFNRTDYNNILNKLGTLRETRLLPYEFSDLASVRWVRGKISVTATQRAEETWKVSDIQGADVHTRVLLEKPSTLDDLIREVEGLKIMTFLDDEKVEAQKDPSLTIELRPKIGAATTWAISALKEGRRVAWSKQRGVVTEVKADNVDAIEKILTAVEPEKKG